MFGAGAQKFEYLLKDFESGFQQTIEEALIYVIFIKEFGCIWPFGFFKEISNFRSFLSI